MIVADRELVESGSDEILRHADKEDVAFLVVGDPYGYICTLLYKLCMRYQRIEKKGVC